MERTFTIHNEVISIDEWCRNNIDENTNIIEALRQCLKDNPVLEPFKAQVRSAIRYWQDDKRLLGDVEIIEIDE